MGEEELFSQQIGAKMHLLLPQRWLRRSRSVGVLRSPPESLICEQVHAWLLFQSHPLSVLLQTGLLHIRKAPVGLEISTRHPTL
jgi:hypothetical protein